VNRVLVLDDEPGIRVLISALLSSAGFEVETASDGQEGLERFLAATGQPFSVVILDLHMSVVDGRTFYRRLREHDATIPVLILSANGADTARFELQAADALSKPFDGEVLIERVSRLLRGQAATNSSRVAAESPARLHHGALNKESMPRERDGQRH
jgi:DNA-binding response OmpR family regulator